MPITFNPFTGNFDNVSNNKKGNEAYSTYSSNSALYAHRDYIHDKFLPLSGGELTGQLSVDSELTIGNVKITNTVYDLNEVPYLIHENEFLTIVVNGQTKLIRYFSVNFPWITEFDSDNIFDEFGNKLLL